MRVLYGREVCRIFAAHGFSEVRRRGSHIAMQKMGRCGGLLAGPPLLRRFLALLYSSGKRGIWVGDCGQGMVTACLKLQVMRRLNLLESFLSDGTTAMGSPRAS
ncbi:MAG: type II toxin-antitoxin system HicA family toxin [bacterium]|nr:type II toxin-antitoxin system HicA family toxin [bacterium]MCY4271362.1 type II toxin-antitoxin system HicA family toxin [bacterium]